MNKGWECPRCNAVMSPTYPTCWYCKPEIKCDHSWDWNADNSCKRCSKCNVSVISKKELDECEHDWDHLLLTSHPPQVKCKKCDEFRIIKGYDK